MNHHTMVKSPLYSLYISYLLISFAFEFTFGLANIAGEGNKVSNQTSRRSFVSSASAISSFLAIPQIAKARFILNEETGEYDEVEDEDWQTAWGKRLDKAKTMTTDEIFLAAQGASNLDSKLGEESEVSKKRRALAGCRNDNLRKRSGMKDTKECTAKVLGGEFQFMIDAMTTN